MPGHGRADRLSGGREPRGHCRAHVRKHSVIPCRMRAGPKRISAQLCRQRPPSTAGSRRADTSSGHRAPAPPSRKHQHQMLVPSSEACERAFPRKADQKRRSSRPATQSQRLPGASGRVRRKRPCPAPEKAATHRRPASRPRRAQQHLIARTRRPARAGNRSTESPAPQLAHLRPAGTGDRASLAPTRRP